jgi:hypothetical protein
MARNVAPATAGGADKTTAAAMSSGEGRVRPSGKPLKTESRFSCYGFLAFVTPGWRLGETETQSTEKRDTGNKNTWRPVKPVL